MGLSGQGHAPDALPPVKGTGTHFEEAGLAPGPVWAGAEILTITGIRSG
jgi:hypothetical protein